jgi:hypothetical protein
MLLANAAGLGTRANEIEIVPLLVLVDRAVWRRVVRLSAGYDDLLSEAMESR